MTPVPVEPTDPFTPLFGLALGGAGVMFLLMLGVIALGVWAAYWFIRLAVRHGGMDVARWERAGMPDRMPKRTRLRASGYSGSYFER
ncbi:hypothetical protein [Microbacterium sp. SS28]|uniref:hypothetical protein n=1 Tax=Microbacterium sp. SS28 TaxID=2919948 RepID=UPI001FA9521A|nr:hypothetical protein [Microbacterium sp. SS28]